MNTFPLNPCRVQFPSAVVVLTGGSRPDYRVVRRSFNRSAEHSHVSAGPRHSDVPTSSRHFLEAFLKMLKQISVMENAQLVGPNDKSMRHF